MDRRQRRIRLGRWAMVLTPREEPPPAFVELNRAGRELRDAVAAEAERLVRWLAARLR